MPTLQNHHYSAQRNPVLWFAWRSALGLWLAAAALAESPQEAARKAMETSVARQAAAVAAMRLSIEKQRAALASAAPPARTADRGAPPSVSFFTLSWPAIGVGCDPIPEAELSPLIQEAAKKEGLEEGLLRAVAEQESGLRACAVSGKGAMGLMQLMPATAQELGVRDPFDPQENLLSGAHFLKQLLARFGGDAALALAAYNAGPARVEESSGVPEIPETLHYVQQILSRLPIP
jgi:soluble lytic murein transglycosylase-like protein